MNVVARHIFKVIIPFGFLVALLAAVLFGGSALSFSSPEGLQFLAREIQAACRDAGTQWMVVVCLASYFVTFLVLERRVLPRKGTERTKEKSSRTQPVKDGSQKSEEKAADSTLHPGPWDTLTPSPSPNPIGRGWRRAVRGGAGVLLARFVLFCGQNSDVWLGAFVVLVLLRYAFDYANAAKSLQVVVLLTGIVIGKGIALWAGWRAGRGTRVEGREPEEKVHWPRSGDTSSGCATFSPSAAENGIEAWCGKRPTSNAQHPTSKESSAPSTIYSQQSTNHQPTAINKAQAVLSLLVMLLACASLWHPERGMEFFYRGVPRWTGPWDNPNLFGLLMGVGTILAVGLFAFRVWGLGSGRPHSTINNPLSTINELPTSNAQLPTSNEVGRGTPGAPANEKERHLTPALSPDDAEREGKRPTFNFQLSTCNAAHWLSLTFYFCAAALCAYGLLKSYSRGAWLGTAVGLGFLIWKWLKQTHLTRNPHPQPLSHPLGEGGVGLSPRPPGGEGESLPRHEDSQLETVQKFSTYNLQPATRRLWLPISILLASVLVLCFWQFRHTEAPLLRRVFSVGNVNDFSWRNRVAAWEGAGRMMWDKPLVGFGWGKAEGVYSKEYRAARLEESAAIQMNDYLMLGISAGVPALGCLILYLGITLSRRDKIVRHPTGNPHPQPLSQPLGEGGVGLSPGEAERVTELSTSNFQLSTIAASGAMVLLLGFWFDGGLFKLPTCVVFWVLVGLVGLKDSTAKYTEDANAERGASVPASRLVGDVTPSGLSGAHGVTRPTIGLRLLAGLVAVVATGLTVLHLVTPQLAVSERTLSIARKLLVPTQEKSDFEFLAPQPIWSGQRLKTLLQHVHLANYNRTLVNWKLDDQLYREFVLSPKIEIQDLPSPRPSPHPMGRGWPPGRERGNEPQNAQPSTIHHPPSTDFDWRRPLWEFFYPRIRKESSLEAAAEIVVRQLGERILMTSENAGVSSIMATWRSGRATEPELSRLQVAALRSVGVPARLTGGGGVEYWNGTQWQVVGRPVQP